MCEQVPKLLGADVELGNFIAGWPEGCRSDGVAARLLLAAIDGIPQYGNGYQRSWYDNGDGRWSQNGSQSCANSQDWGRKFLATNGASAYIDLQHAELALSELMSAYDFNAAWQGAMRIAGQAAAAVNRQMTGGRRLHVLANNSDGKGNSYGSHLNVLITRRAFNNLFHRKLHLLLFLASHQVSSIIYTGQGKVGSENSRPHVDFQISQRADFFETLVGLQTTYNRPIVNSRDESLCGEFGNDRPWCLSGKLARLHCIFYDSGLCETAGTVLKVGALQLVAALCEAEQFAPDALLDDPVRSVVRWSHDPDLQVTARRIDGKATTATDLQRRILDCAWSFEARRGFDGIVPHARRILQLWTDVVDRLARRDFSSLRGSVDWILKRHLIESFLRQHNLSYDCPQARHLDLMYSNLDPQHGLYWACQRQGLIQRISTDDEIRQFISEPPDDTRAWVRAQLLRRAGHQVAFVDWDRIVFSLPDHRGWPARRTLAMPNPLGMRKQDVGDLFEREMPLDQLLDQLEAHLCELPWTERNNLPFSPGEKTDEISRTST